MFHHAFKYLLSTLLMTSLASAAALPPSQALSPRQGSCLSALSAPNPVNTIGRLSFQWAIDQPARTQEAAQASWSPSNFVDFHMTVPTDILITQNVNVTVINRSSRSNAIILTNYQDTRTSTAPRAQVRVAVPAQTRGNGVRRLGRTETCLYLPRLDGTWYFQLEHD
ncbi:hypothetical protein COCMIDRAFT_6505 [Bipolaris oryzae ATCC 44560]|uniref:Uncharacterized protein n=1 Tax=Bipolaris oryzae ATCC 44560 TaxID=930090 RepID=W6Z9H1_COCMI|nr:uncharacterized protein COCMIDRAFT_6505 [Bipolaris oryzae ATCC 44560]EUC44184.1 hypothetical protein COCMIDRAFT_6505 [Bipolaris oryzae ATCC 44560]